MSNSREDYYGCRADAEHEALAELAQEVHDLGECQRGCWLCEEENALVEQTCEWCGEFRPAAEIMPREPGEPVCCWQCAEEQDQRVGLGWKRRAR